MRALCRGFLLLLCSLLLVVPTQLPGTGAAAASTAGASATATGSDARSLGTQARIKRAKLKRIQRRLNRLRCDSGRANGRMDRHVRSAVVRFKTRHGLKANGKVSRRTRNILFSRQAKRCDRRPVLRGTGKGRRIVISERQNWIWLVRANGRVAVQGPMIDNPRVLRPGNYATGSYCGRAARIRHNSDLNYRYWLDQFVRFAPCGIGFHRIPRWKSSGRQKHANWLLGTNFDRSDGCIRLTKRMSERVWDFTASRRTRVMVR